jgi:hypothetical protein
VSDEVRDDYLENLKFKNIAGYQVSFSQIENSCGIKFDIGSGELNYKVLFNKLGYDNKKFLECERHFGFRRGEGKGSIKVRAVNSCGTSAYSPTLNLTGVSCFAKNSGEAEKIDLNELFEVQAYPNPSKTDFRLELQSNSQETVTIRITDVYGNTKGVYLMKSNNNQLLVGHKLMSGTYFAEVVQGSNRKVLKLIKLN